MRRTARPRDAFASTAATAGAMTAALALTMAACGQAAPPAAPPADVHASALVLDAHADIENPLDTPERTGTSDAGTQIDLAKMKRGGVDAVLLSVHAPQGPRTPEGIAIARRIADAKVDAIRAIADRHPADAAIAVTADDVRRVAASGRIAIVLTMLNAFPLGDDLTRLAGYRERGVRMIGFTHAGNNQFADSDRPFARDTPDALGGLSDLGRRAVAEANRLGMVLDVSQLSPQALLQVARLSKAPVLASHSGIRAIVDTSRNLRDDELDAVAAGGGAVCIVAYSGYLKTFTPEEQAPMAEVLRRFGGLANGYDGLSAARKEELYRAIEANAPRAAMDDYIASIDYAVKRIGIDHVCLSSDFNHGFAAIQGWTDESEARNVTDALLRRGYDAAAVDKLWSGNVLRVLAEAERAASR